MITKDSIIIDIIESNPEAKQTMEDYGLHCVAFACPYTLSETLETACITHGVDIDQLLADLNRDG